MEMVKYDRAKVRKPADLAKLALRAGASECLSEADWPATGIVTFTLGEVEFTFEAKPTASLRDGRIMYHFGGRDEFKGLEITFGGNALLPTAVPTHSSILKQYGVTAPGRGGEPTDAELSVGESTQ